MTHHHFAAITPEETGARENQRLHCFQSLEYLNNVTRCDTFRIDYQKNGRYGFKCDIELVELLNNGLREIENAVRNHLGETTGKRNVTRRQ